MMEIAKNFCLRHACEGVRVHPGKLQQGGFREASVEGNLRFPEHLDIVLVHRLVARA
jgi:hypothetical protein